MPIEKLPIYALAGLEGDEFLVCELMERLVVVRHLYENMILM